ncbi:MAG: MFS transporter [Planctomycetota bacterium]|nr:MAG: MFS transporter [Planctomycetota bacterium]
MPPVQTLPSSSAIIRRALLGQLLFSSGHALTTGGFLSYFAAPFFRDTGLGFSLLLVIPEMAESLAILTRPVVDWIGSRKRLWWSGLILARLAAWMIPALVLQGMTPDSRFAGPMMLASVVVWYLLQGMSFNAYLSWLSDLVPEVNWGRLLARRSMAISLVTLTMTLIAAASLEGHRPDPATLRNQYAFLFTLGGLLCLSSILPMRQLPDLARWNPDSPAHQPLNQRLHQAFADRSFRRFLIGCWQLSFFQGLTQTPNYVLSAKILGVSQLHYYALSNAMLVLQIPLALLGGRWVDRGQDRRIMVWGVLGLSLAMGCWELATWWGPGWLIPAYLIWGGFGLINVALISLTFKLAPRSDNTAHLALSRQLGGLLAAVAGITGGLVLSHFTPEAGPAPMKVFRGIYLVSWIGRATAAYWFLGPEPVHPTQEESVRTAANSESPS